jgi:hypothetical protein
MTAVAEALAARAVDRSLQVVVVFVGAVAADPVGVEDSLHVCEGLLVHECGVKARALDALAGDDAGVVVVAQHAMNHAARERAAGALHGRARAEPGVREDLDDARNRVLASLGQVEGERYVGRTLWIDGDRGDLASVDVLAHVQIADRRQSVSASLGELALEAHLDLRPVIARAKGVDAGHDREQQQPLRAVVDRLAGGDKLRTAAVDLTEQPEGVGLVAGDAREVVEDDVGRAQLRQLAQQLLERLPPRVGAGAPRLCVLAHDARPQRSGVAFTGLALAGDRVAQRVVRLVDLSGA